MGCSARRGGHSLRRDAAATIRYRITGHPCQPPAILQSQSSAGKRLSLQPSGIYHVKRSTELLQALERFMEEEGEPQRGI